MDESGKSFASEPVNVRQWIGRIIVAVILGEAIWNLIVSVMNHVFVPWLGALMGPGSGLPTSFIQRPYDYPDLFVSVFEFCIAGLVAAILNYFLQRPKAARARPVKNQNPVRVVQPAPVPVIPRPAPIAATAMTQAPSPAPPVVRPAPVVAPAPVVPPTPVVAAAPIVRPEPIAPPAPVISAPPAPPVANPVVAAKPIPPPPAPPKPAPPAAKAEPPKPKKPKEVYYNIVGEPMPSDDD
jgi:large-conductance mechanosensitive channel